MSVLAIVVPCFNEEAVLPQTAAALLEVLDRLTRAGKISPASQICFVDDGSRDRTWALIEEHAARDVRVHGIKLSRNHGHQKALLAGLMTTTGDAVVSIDADLQDDVGVIERMVDEFRAGRQVVLGVRDDRSSDSWRKRIFAETYYRLLRRMGVDVVFNHADFRLLSRRALDTLKEYSEVNLFLRGVVPTIGFPTAIVSYDRKERFAGATKYNLRRMLSLAVEGVTSFSALPLRMIAVLGILIFFGSLGLSIWVVCSRLFSQDVVPGWASSVLPMYFLGGVQLLSIGIVGEYVAKIYMETKRRPRFIVEKVI
jgi:glycosyltransferase involved in cell wall biosynthesis